MYYLISFAREVIRVYTVLRPMAVPVDGHLTDKQKNIAAKNIYITIIPTSYCETKSKIPQNQKKPSV